MKKYEVKLIETYAFCFEVEANQQSGSGRKSQRICRQASS